MKTTFIPIDYDYFDFQDRNYMKIFGRNSQGKRICVIDSCPVYFWAILEDGLDQKKTDNLIEKIKKIKLDMKGRKTKVEAVELHKKNFLGKEVNALKIFATNYKDLHDIADRLGLKEIAKRRGYDLGFITHYIIEKKLSPLQWYEIEGEVLDNSLEFGGADSELEVDLCIKLESEKRINDLGFRPKILTYDIETEDIKLGEGEILMVSMVSENFKKVITWKKALDSAKKPDYVEYVKDEADLIETFVSYVKKIAPDFLVGYFSDGFDLPYMKIRSEKNKIKLSLSLDGSQPRFSRGIEVSAKTKGLVHIDLLKFIRTAYSQYMQSETLSLNEVAKEFLGEGKKDFKPRHSSKLSDHHWENYFEYNLHDSVLVYGLFEKMWPDVLEFTRIMHEPVAEVSRNGMSKNVESFILHNLEKFDEIPEKRPTSDEIGERRRKEKYVGAFVFEPTPGFYEDIAVFDFTSSYGSTIVTYNLSKSTLLEKQEKNSYSIEIEGKKVYFSKKPGFFPEMLKEIIGKRKIYKVELQEKPDVIKKARSNAFKLLTNAAYGYQGFFGARYYSREAAAATAAFARKAIKDSINKINKHGYKVIYSDSVGGKTKIIVKRGNEIYEEKIENLFKKADQKDVIGKEYDFRNDMNVLTLNEKGKSVFRPIKYVMRHKSNKKMFRVHFTNNWYIDVTEDHSLMGYQATNFNQSKGNKENILNRIIKIKPKEIGKRANSIISLKKIPSDNVTSKGYPKELYEFMGYFIGDGSFMPNKYGKDYYLRISAGKDLEEIKEKIFNPLKNKGYIRNIWERPKGDIVINGLKIVNIISKDFRTNQKKIIPEWLFEENEENIESFLRGLFSADGCVIRRNNASIVKYTSINEEFIEKTRKLLYRVGISHSIFRDNTQNKYKTNGKIYSSGSYSKNIIIKNNEDFSRKIGFVLERKNKLAGIKSKSLKKKLIKDFEFDIQAIKRVEEIKTKKYVYDLEVEGTHTFFANYVLAHNTDSIAFLMQKRGEKETMEFLEKLNSELPGIMEMELEGFFKRGLWVTKRTGTIGAKKKYALLGKDGKVKIRGFETVRRDWCTLARKTQNEIIRMILQDGDEKRAVVFLKDIVKNVKERKVPKEEMIIKTMLQKPLSEYKTISPHVIAARKMQEQEIPISGGNLIEYFIAETREKKKLVREKVKLPEEKGEYNIEYYLQKQILPAVENIFQVFNINVNEIIEGRKQTKLGDF